jgi:hypothetical protein
MYSLFGTGVLFWLLYGVYRQDACDHRGECDYARVCNTDTAAQTAAQASPKRIYEVN